MDNSMPWKKVSQRSATKPLLYGALAAIVQALISWLASAELPTALAGLVPVAIAVLQFALVEVKKQSMAESHVNSLIGKTHATTGYARLSGEGWRFVSSDQLKSLEDIGSEIVWDPHGGEESVSDEARTGPAPFIPTDHNGETLRDNA